MAVSASLGCGNPTALAKLNEGDTVLDLGSGGGIDVLLSARRVGPTGKVYGLDMTDDMLALARENQRKAGVTNVEFLKGELENIPLPDASVDVIISNCVVNLSADKDRALREALWVVRGGGGLGGGGGGGGGGPPRPRGAGRGGSGGGGGGGARRKGFEAEEKGKHGHLNRAHPRPYNLKKKGDRPALAGGEGNGRAGPRGGKGK